MREYKTLCTLGLPTREVVPLALRLLERMVGGSLFSFIWANARLEAVDTYLLEPIPDSYAQIYAEVFYNRREAEVGPTFTDILRNKIPLVNFSSLGAKLLDSALYAEIFRPMGMPHALRAAVIDGERRHGVFAITRPPGRGFSEADEKTILHAARYLAYAFELERADKLVRDETMETADEGFLLLGSDGKIHHGSETGLRLFHEATRADGVHLQAAASRETLPAALVAQAQAERATRETVLCNLRGEFVFRPFLLRATATGAPPQVAATVRRRGLLSARLWQESGRFKLSDRERQITVLLGLGYGYDEIAERLDLSRNTAVSYIRRSYEKLGITQREQLMRTLLTAPDSAR